MEGGDWEWPPYCFITVTVTMDPPPPTIKTRKPWTIKPYAKARGPNVKNRPATSAQPSKKAKSHLTNNNQVQVYDWVDKHPHAMQAEIVQHFTTQPESTLTFDQGTLSHNLGKKSTEREAEVALNPAALSSKWAHIFTRPNIDQVLVIWVSDHMSNNQTVSGPELSTKQKIFEEKFKVPEEEQLSKAGWLQAFYKRSSVSSLYYLNPSINNSLNNRYGLKEMKRHGEAASTDLKVVEEERVRHKMS